MPSDDRWEQFEGYDPPRYTPVPDELFDWQLRDLGLAELKVLLFIIRKTLGYKKNEDAISLTQICEATGLGRKAVSQAVKSLEERRAIYVVRRKSSRGDAAVNMYVLNIKGEGGSFLRKLPWFPEETTVVSSGNPQEGILQEGILQDENESPAVENSTGASTSAGTDRRPSGDSLSTMKQIAREAADLLNNGRQYRSILGFLRNYDPDVAREALRVTIARLKTEHDIQNPIGYFYTIVKTKQADRDLLRQRSSKRRTERLAAARSFARQLMREWGPHHTRCILLDTYGDKEFVDQLLAEIDSESN